MVACRPPSETIVLLPAPTCPRRAPHLRSIDHQQSKSKTRAGAPAARPGGGPENVACSATHDPTGDDLPIPTFLSRVLRRPVESTLTAAIGVVDQSSHRAADRQGLAERRERQIPMQAVTGGPSHDPPCEQVDDNSKIKP